MKIDKRVKIEHYEDKFIIIIYNNTFRTRVIDSEYELNCQEFYGFDVGEDIEILANKNQCKIKNKMQDLITRYLKHSVRNRSYLW